MDDLRKPFFYTALILLLLVVLIELGAGLSLRGAPPAGGVMNAISGALPPELRDILGDVDPGDVEDLADAAGDVPGIGIPYMALLDGMLLFTVGLVASSMLITDRVQGRVQGCATFILSLLLVIASIALIFAAIFLLLLMVSLLLAVPFGTIVYLAVYGFFNRGGASAVLSLLMLLKIGFVICLVLAQQRFLQNRGLVLLVLSSLVANIILSFLHGFVPIPLVSITDALGAIIMGICGCLWWLLALIGAVPAILKVIRARA
jgi:hypothetical protein